MTETETPRKEQESNVQSVVDNDLTIKMVESNSVEISGPKSKQLDIWQKLNDTEQFEIISSCIVKKRFFVLKLRLRRKLQGTIQDLSEHVRSIIS